MEKQKKFQKAFISIWKFKNIYFLIVFENNINILVSWIIKNLLMNTLTG